MGWYVARVIGALWCTSLFVMLAWQILWFGEVQIKASEAHNLSTGDAIAWLIGFGCASISLLRELSQLQQGER